jgi:hypothetical protein
MTTSEFTDKIAWEGGVQGAIEYGLLASDADDPRLGGLWQAIADRYAGGRRAVESLEELTTEFYRYAGSIEAGLE